MWTQEMFGVEKPIIALLHLDALDSVAFSGTKAEGWYLPAVQQAMEEGKIAYAGKYSAPDYETILAADCGLAIENTMIYHTPEVKEQLEKFGVPVLVERSSYESGPLARMEWVKLYGILLGKTNEAERVFADAEQRIAPLADEAPTGKTVAFFSITSNNLATVRKGGDYVAEMIKMAGGSYAFADLTDSGNNLATVNISLEDFYAGAKDADVLIYNSTIEGELRSIDELIAKCPMLADFKAVQSGNVWCTAQSLFQQSMELPDLILDMNKVFTEGTHRTLLQETLDTHKAVLEAIKCGDSTWARDAMTLHLSYNRDLYRKMHRARSGEPPLAPKVPEWVLQLKELTKPEEPEEKE